MTPVSPHPFASLSKEQKLEVTKQFKDQNGFAMYFKSVANHISKGAEASKEVLEWVDKLNAKAAEVLRRENTVTLWRNKRPTIIQITEYLSLAQQGCVVGIGSALVSCLIHRSNRFFMGASLCAAAAFLALRSIASCWQHAFNEVRSQLDKLSWANQVAFVDEVNGIYQELAKANYLTRAYLGAHAQTPFQDLLKEQLNAYKGLCKLLKGMMGMSGKSCFDRDQPFFKKFAHVARQGLMLSGSWMLLSAGWTYYASLQRAYLMACIGVIHTVGALAISRELFVSQKYSHKIGEATDDTYAEACQELLHRSWLIRGLRALPCTFRAEIVEPFDAILKLIPSWKNPNEN